MGTHLIDGEFQSDKYPTTPRGKVPLSVKDKSAQDLLWEYAQRRRSVDAEFADDLESALKIAGYSTPPSEHVDQALPFRCRVCGVECNLMPDPPAQSVCPAHCEDHEYEYQRDLCAVPAVHRSIFRRAQRPRGHYCKYCGQAAPDDFYEE